MAYQGELRFYVRSHGPVLRTYVRPAQPVPAAREMPPGLRSHCAYPRDLLEIQSTSSIPTT